MMKKPLLLIFSVICLTLGAEVFTLWPYQGGSRTEKSKMTDVLTENPLFSERISFNGCSVRMDVYNMDVRWDDLPIFTQKRFRQENLFFGKDFVRASNRLPSGMIERFLFIPKNDGRITVFYCTAPEKVPENPAWPPELPPLPEGAKVSEVIHFPDRKAVYGSFENAGQNVEFTLSSLVRQLKNDGFRPLGKEALSAAGGTGEILFRASPRAFLWINFSRSGRGAYYLKK